VVGDLVPATVQVTKVTSSDFECGRDGNAVECTKASLAVGASGTVQIEVSVPSTALDGTVVNVGTVEAVTPDPDLTNNSDEAEVVIVAQAPPTTQAPAPVTLPKTGSDATKSLTEFAMLFMLLGGAIVLITRRRRPTLEA
jgi:LPXTG-motif cell wall-anchored protein